MTKRNEVDIAAMCDSYEANRQNLDRFLEPLFENANYTCRNGFDLKDQIADMWTFKNTLVHDGNRVDYPSIWIESDYLPAWLETMCISYDIVGHPAEHDVELEDTVPLAFDAIRLTYAPDPFQDLEEKAADAELNMTFIIEVYAKGARWREDKNRPTGEVIDFLNPDNKETKQRFEKELVEEAISTEPIGCIPEHKSPAVNFGSAEAMLSAMRQQLGAVRRSHQVNGGGRDFSDLASDREIARRRHYSR